MPASRSEIKNASRSNNGFDLEHDACFYQWLKVEPDKKLTRREFNAQRDGMLRDFKRELNAWYEEHWA